MKRSIISLLVLIFLSSCSPNAAMATFTPTPLPTTTPTYIPTATPTFSPTFTPTPAIDPNQRTCTIEGLCESVNDTSIPIMVDGKVVREIPAEINPEARERVVQLGKDIVWMVYVLNEIQEGRSYISPEAFYKKYPDGKLPVSLELHKHHVKNQGEQGVGEIIASKTASSFKNITFNFAPAGVQGNRVGMGGGYLSLVANGQDGYTITISPNITRYLKEPGFPYLNDTLTDAEAKVQMSRLMALLYRSVEKYKPKQASFFDLGNGIISAPASFESTDKYRMGMDGLRDHGDVLEPYEDTFYVR